MTGPRGVYGSGNPENPRQTADLPWDPVSGDVICYREGTRMKPEGDRLHFNIGQEIIHHSPAGWEWGYAGSGPADFALNVLHRFLAPGCDGRQPVRCRVGVVSALAFALHQRFKVEWIATLPDEGGTLSGAEIREWIAACRDPRPEGCDLRVTHDDLERDAAQDGAE